MSSDDLLEAESEALRLLELHGVRLEDAQQNFEGERTLVVPASEIARSSIVMSEETRRYVSARLLADAAMGAQMLDDKVASEPESMPGSSTDASESPPAAVLPTNVALLEHLKVPSIRPTVDCVEVLVSHDGFTAGHRFFLRDNVLLFGRGYRCGVRFGSVDVSRNHCLIERKGREFLLVDANSTNGVLLNGRRVEREARLKHADKIQIHKTVFALLTPVETTKVFISYGTPDADFARTLAAAMRGHGFDVFFFADSAQDYAGDRVFAVTRGQISERDVVLLVCSKASLERRGVLAELNHVLAKEEKLGAEVFLVPIALDDSFLHWRPQNPVLADAIRERVVLDFRELDSEGARNEAFARLAKRLRTFGPK